MIEWKQTNVASVCKRVTSGGTPKTNNKNYYGGLIPWLKTQEVNYNRIWDTETKITEQGLAESSAKIIEENSIIVAMYGVTAGRVAINKVPLSTNQACCNLTPDKLICDYQFLYYYLTDKYNELAGLSSGAAQQNLSVGVVSNFPLLLPPLLIQKSIAEVLSSLDDKIDLLQRQNKTLEQMAEAMFRQWFVEEADDGWPEGCIGDFVVNINRSVQPGSRPPDTCYVGLEHIDRRSIALVTTGNFGSVESSKYEFERGDILFGKLRPYFHKICIASSSGVCSTDILVLRPKSGDISAFCLFLLFQDDVVEYCNVSSGGTRMPRTSWEMLRQYPVKVPPETKIAFYDKMGKDIVVKIWANIDQIHALQECRDTLLPKLMSGTVRVSP